MDRPNRDSSVSASDVCSDGDGEAALRFSDVFDGEGYGIVKAALAEEGDDVGVGDVEDVRETREAERRVGILYGNFVIKQYSFLKLQRQRFRIEQYVKAIK